MRLVCLVDAQTIYYKGSSIYPSLPSEFCRKYIYTFISMVWRRMFVFLLYQIKLGTHTFLLLHSFCNVLLRGAQSNTCPIDLKELGDGPLKLAKWTQDSNTFTCWHSTIFHTFFLELEFSRSQPNAVMPFMHTRVGKRLDFEDDNF